MSEFTPVHAAAVHQAMKLAEAEATARVGKSSATSYTKLAAQLKATRDLIVKELPPEERGSYE